MTDLYSLVDIAKMDNTPPQRTLYNWLTDGIIEPKTKKGSRSYFSEKTIREVRVLKMLRNYFSLQKLKDVHSYLKSIGHNPYSRGNWLIIDTGKEGNERYRLQKEMDGKTIELTNNNRGQLVLPLWMEDNENNK